jgi:hypothetical protein
MEQLRASVKQAPLEDNPLTILEIYYQLMRAIGGLNKGSYHSYLPTTTSIQ